MEEVLYASSGVIFRVDTGTLGGRPLLLFGTGASSGSAVVVAVGSVGLSSFVLVLLTVDVCECRALFGE